MPPDYELFTLREAERRKLKEVNFCLEINNYGNTVWIDDYHVIYLHTDSYFSYKPITLFLCVNRKGLKRGSLEFMKSPHMLRVSMPRWRLCDKQFLPSTSLIPVRHKAVTRQHVCTRTHSLCSLQPEVILPRDLDFPCQFCTYVKLNGETFQLQTAGLRRKILMATSTRRGKCFLCRHVCTYTHICRQVIQHKSMANSCVIKAMPKKNSCLSRI